jgi:glycosyltransferase involved in cell wall biosynthesis
LKVLLDLQYLNVATTGIKTYMLELANAAKSYPHPEIEWVFTHDPDKQSADQAYKGNQSKFQKLHYHLDYFRWKEFQLPDLVKQHQPDVLLCPDFVSPAVSLACRRLTVVHDAFFWQMPQNYPRWWREYFLRLIKKGLKENTEIVTTTAYARQSLLEHLGDELPISVVYQAPKDLTAEPSPSFLEEKKLRKEGYFLHIGTFDKRKNLPLLVDAYADFLSQTQSDKKLVLAGGPGHSRVMNDLPLVEEMVNKMGLSEKVLLPGYVSDGEVRALYESAYAYVFPSENEGFGIPVIEAMGFGVPVIHSDQPALMEVAGGAGLPFQSGSRADLTEKLVLLHREKELRSGMIQAGYARSKDFSAQKFVTAFQEIILRSPVGT